MANLRGDTALARRWLEDAARACDACSMQLYAAVARRALASYQGGQGAGDPAERWMRDSGVRAPARLSRMLAPGATLAG
jgi:hypothetical protein